MTDEIINEDAELNEDERHLLDDLRREDADELSGEGEARRKFLKQISATGAAILAAQILAEEKVYAASPAESSGGETAAAADSVAVKLRINGAEKVVNIEPRVSLLDALRERLDLTGTKKGCDHGQCGACTVLIDGRRTLSCLTLAVMSDGQKITTIEGLAKGDALHSMQEAFIKHDGFQCGYCTPGQICSAVALINEAKNGDASYVSTNLRAKPRGVNLSDEEIRERMSGNLCRCGAYPNIVAAIREVHTGRDVAQTWQFSGEKEQTDETV